jgi:hypothetical protein
VAGNCRLVTALISWVAQVYRIGLGDSLPMLPSDFICASRPDGTVEKDGVSRQMMAFDLPKDLS